MGAQHTEASQWLQDHIRFCRIGKVGNRTFSAQEIYSQEIEASLSHLRMWNSYEASNVESFQVCRYFDQCGGSILLMSIPPGGEQEFVCRFS